MVPTSAQRLAERIYAHELREATTADAVGVVKHTHQKLAQALSPVIGEAGFAAMMGRAVQIVRVQYRFLDGIATGLPADAFPSALAACLKGQEPNAIQSVGGALLARFLVLLSTFIGNDLALRLLFSTWPDAIAHAIDAAEKP